VRLRRRRSRRSGRSGRCLLQLRRATPAKLSRDARACQGEDGRQRGVRAIKRNVASDASPSKRETPSKPAPPSAMPSLPPNDHDVRKPLAKDSDGAEGAKRRRGRMTKEDKEAQAAVNAELDAAFLETFDPKTDWLPPETAPEDYTPEFCRKLERRYWRKLGLGRPAWYGADTAGTLFTPDTIAWNVDALPSMLARLLPTTGGVLPGVNAPYLYFGTWRATFA
jgi:hypothetical protein